MAETLQGMLNQILAAVPEGVSPFDGLRGYFLSQVYHQTDAFDRGCYAIMGLCSGVIALMLLALVFRWRSGSLTLVIRDGAMSRPDFRTFCPIFYVAFAASEIVQSAIIVKAYRDQHWTAFGGAFQYMSLAFIVMCGYTLVFNVLASNPSVRRALMNIGSLNRSRGPMGVLILNALLLFCILASIGSLVPSALILAREMPGQNDDVAAIFAVIAQAEAANDLRLLAGLAGPVTTLLGRGDEVKYAIKLAGYTTCAWLVGIWTLGGTVAYVSLVRAVKDRIAKLERFVMEEETRQAETDALYSTVVELPRGAKTKVQPTLAADKPFANLVPTTDMPAKYSDIIGSQISETSTKIRQLKVVLRKDQITHFLYLIMILIFSTESVMHACGGVDGVETTKLLPMVHSYLAAAFLSTALPLGFTFLFDSFRLWRHQYAGSQYGGSSSSFSPQGLTYDIPLHVSARGPLSSEKRNAHHHQSATSLPMHAHSLGVMVSQEHAVVVESSFSKNEKDDADKYSI